MHTGTFAQEIITLVHHVKGRCAVIEGLYNQQPLIPCLCVDLCLQSAILEGGGSPWTNVSQLRRRPRPLKTTSQKSWLWTSDSARTSASLSESDAFLVVNRQTVLVCCFQRWFSVFLFPQRLQRQREFSAWWRGARLLQPPAGKWPGPHPVRKSDVFHRTRCWVCSRCEALGTWDTTWRGGGRRGRRVLKSP